MHFNNTKYIPQLMNRTGLLFIIFLLISVELSAQKNYHPTDQAIAEPAPYNYKANQKYKGVAFHSFYLAMRDSVLLAIDLYLPKGLEPEAKIPAILHQTRYWRAPQLRWLWKWFMNPLLGTAGKYIQEIIACGYAVVNVDARGSGASFGSRPYPWSADEVKDGAEIIDWIIKQPWSNGKVGAIGASYSGTTAEFLATNQHPALKAVVLMYSLFDVYDDIAFPGGVFNRFFVNNWGKFNSLLDEDKLPRGNFIIRLLVKGVERVAVDHKMKTFRKALADHQSNINVDETSKGVDFRDDSPKSEIGKTGDVFSPHTYFQRINKTTTVVYSYTGWLDGDYQHSSIRRYLNLTNPANKLIIGPWEHGGKYNCSPANAGLAGFDHIGEILKFFDYYLKDIPTGIDKEAPIHYFTMGEEKWKASDTWPPSKTVYMPLFLDKNNSISYISPGEFNSFDTYKVDTTATTGFDTRWKSTIGMLHTPHVYPGRKERDKKLLCYNSVPLPTDVEVTGHPIITLYVSSTQTDGNFHAYLEDVDPDGDVHYVTEGLLRGIQRKVSTEKPPYKDVVPYHSYLKKDAMPLITGEIAELKFDLLPTSYLFKQGHSFRIAIAGADKDQFKVMAPGEPEIRVYHDRQHASKLEIPVIPPPDAK